MQTLLAQNLWCENKTIFASSYKCSNISYSLLSYPSHYPSHENKVGDACTSLNFSFRNSGYIFEIYISSDLIIWKKDILNYSLYPTMMWNNAVSVFFEAITLEVFTWYSSFVPEAPNAIVTSTWKSTPSKGKATCRYLQHNANNHLIGPFLCSTGHR